QGAIRIGEPVILGSPQRPRPSSETRVAYLKGSGAIRFSDEHGQELAASSEMVAKAIQSWDDRNRWFDLYGPPPWVMAPENLQRRAIVQHVKELTQRAIQLLLLVLDEVQIPRQIRQQIRDLETLHAGTGWVLWLQLDVRLTGPTTRIENYPQVAATGVMML